MNPPKRSYHPDPLEWLAHARSDLRLAELALDREILPEQICFHAQQAAEKALKAVLLHRCVDFPFTHDLAQLIETAKGAGLELPPDAARADELTPFAVETRYPGVWGAIEDQDVSEALAIARAVLRWAEASVGRTPQGSDRGP